jgi:hypothetical protein
MGLLYGAAKSHQHRAHTGHGQLAPSTAVRFTAMYPDLFDLSTPNRLWKSTCRIWRSGQSLTDERVKVDCCNWRRNVKWIIKAEGGVVPELNVRHGRRKEKRKETAREAAQRRAAHRKTNPADLPFPTRAQLKAGWRAIDTEGEGEDTDAAMALTAQAYSMIPIDEELSTMCGPTAAVILQLGQGDRTTGPQHLRRGLRTRCKVLGLSTNGNSAALRERLAEKLGRELPAGYTEWKPHSVAATGQQPEAAAQAAATRARAPAAAAAPQSKRRRRRG